MWLYKEKKPTKTKARTSLLFFRHCSKAERVTPA